MIKRLQRELNRRQELQNQLISILQKKQKIELELEKKKLKIEELKINLQNLIKVKKRFDDLMLKIFNILFSSLLLSSPLLLLFLEFKTSY